ncbi:MAG: hypothetical protein H6R04_45 [Burkholderiaceae bacterium]|nr:hypothetical protein [Burkholderiaceae bacterium]
MDQTRHHYSPLPFHGCERGLSCSRETPCFVPHPWSLTGDTCVYASAYMRAFHTQPEPTRSLTGEVTYKDAVEVQMKVSLLNRKKMDG